MHRGATPSPPARLRHIPWVSFYSSSEQPSPVVCFHPGPSVCTPAPKPLEPLVSWGLTQPPTCDLVAVGQHSDILLQSFCPGDSAGNLRRHRVRPGQAAVGLLPEGWASPLPALTSPGSIQPPRGAVPDWPLSLFLPFAFSVRLFGPLWVFTGQRNGERSPGVQFTIQP